MKTWDRFLKDVRPWAPGTPAPVAEHAVLRAAQDFFEMTRAWVMELDAITTEEGVLSYDIELPKNTEIVRIESATVGTEGIPVWRSGPNRHRRYVSTRDRSTVQFSQPPAAGAELVLTCSVRPGESAIGIEDHLFAAYARDIAKGAVAEVLNDAGRRLMFEDRCSTIAYQVWKGSSSATPRARANFF